MKKVEGSVRIQKCTKLEFRHRTRNEKPLSKITTPALRSAKLRSGTANPSLKRRGNQVSNLQYLIEAPPLA
ncbi:MAG: hypothetical protein UU40_C0006G0034 [Candidatus Uhrbacteria bacterium GW2011_GWD2_41_121]|uniref:Uncharacterized protein n=1 Tax=Candidatus Uhrbacteria bacterium GW2011_GWC1_41_20 TaxID=1618983 RepID=A0A0G0VEJ7_9BACT|nr:MAG: hypothetical protein UT52_C0009G0034 [Candidatus Uhrbacteria bacterium GW2011_GWE1_39_46]KKR63991.1 MAG: hypothetical protein UU04_C0008G0034 [Candidatus Uhrbacteria bacterium GW2011_GWC2_40_450]KKR89333.1 MAG: hypothetical protein UU36_C0033G0002 [Candidatus Uhrbacteria bacterium GW2011_GWE2_41_1153]KKR90250.1 MAG: hypothetical protein UU40_C0006G0034 [Candidatus Uhrbacteria bacterium GW2011_GWD2_41_121]KKR95631.1 MAG: hypothetical protein UU46_C0018G0020 [Candidatus Uhrbacteria bacter